MYMYMSIYIFKIFLTIFVMPIFEYPGGDISSITRKTRNFDAELQRVLLNTTITRKAGWKMSAECRKSPVLQIWLMKVWEQIGKLNLSLYLPTDRRVTAGNIRLFGMNV